MALDDATLAGIRAWVGSTPDDGNVEGRFDRLGSIELVALEVLRGRLADWLANPAKVALEGDADWSFEKNIDVVVKQIRQLEGLVSAAGSTVTVGRLIRHRRGR